MSHVRGPCHDVKKATVLLLQATVFNKRVDFLVDSGAERSVIPLSLVPTSLILPSTTKLTGVDGKPLVVFGHIKSSIGIKSLRRNLTVNFIITNTKPILGADFLTEFGLILNMKDSALTDSLTNISCKLIPSKGENKICISEEVGDNNYIKENFPSLITAPNYSFLPPNFDVEHRIETTGPPVYSRV